MTPTRYRIASDVPSLGWKQGDTIRVEADGIVSLHRPVLAPPHEVSDALAAVGISLDAPRHPVEGPGILPFRRPTKRARG